MLLFTTIVFGQKNAINKIDSVAYYIKLADFYKQKNNYKLSLSNANNALEFASKNKDAKNYAGYLVFEFKYKNILVYKIQTDYMKLDASDIEDRMNCAIKSFTSIN